MKFHISLIFIIAFFAAAPSTFADEVKAIHQKEHLDALSVYKKNADDYVSKNLNRFALNQLLNYDAAIDTMYKSEMADTISAFKLNYGKSHASRNKTITDLNRQIQELSDKKEKASSGFTGLLRKAGIASAIWLVIVLLLVQIRTRTLNKVQARLDVSTNQLNTSMQKKDAGLTLLKLARENSSVFESLHLKAETIQKLFTEAPITTEKGFSKEVADKLKITIADLVRSASSGNKIISTIRSQESEAGDEKVNASLNILCDQCFELVYAGMKSENPDLKISVSKDLEKNLPQIKLIPGAIAQLLINVLINAFQSVQERQELKVKGYIPKVTISTRVLPRFLQVRVHDNGMGMTDDIIQQVCEPYFTMKSSSHASGLGMSNAKTIAGELHRGELKIESEPGNKTDVYLKFFTS